MKPPAIAVLVAVLVVLVIIVAVGASRRAPAASQAVAPAASLLGVPLKLTYDSSGAYRTSIALSGGATFRPMIDTGSPSLNLPNSLKSCTECVLTGVTQKLSYAGGASDDLKFATVPISFGGRAPVPLTFGGTTNSPAGSDSVPVLGLMSLLAPAGYAKPAGASVVDQLGATALTIDLRKKKGDGALTFWAETPPAPKGATLAYSAALVSATSLWADDVDTLGDFFAVPASSSQISTLTSVIIDTGSTYSHMPVAANFGTSTALTLEIAGKPLTLPAAEFTTFSEFDKKVGVLGLAALSGYFLVLDRGGSVLRMYR